MSTYRTFTTAFKRQVAQEFLAGASLNALGRKHEVARNLIRIWVAKYGAATLRSFGPGGCGVERLPSTSRWRSGATSLVNTIWPKAKNLDQTIPHTT